MTSFVNVNGFNCRYELSGKDDAPETIIFVNGIACPLESWNLIKEPLDKKYRSLCYDMRGQWFSEVTTDKPYSFLMMADDLYELSKKLDIESAHIVGTSLGGEVGLWFALMYPQKVKSLSILASASEINELMRVRVERWRRCAVGALNAIEKSDGDSKVLSKQAEEFYDCLLPDTYSNTFLESNLSVIDQKRDGFKALVTKEFFAGQINLYDMFFKLNGAEKITDRLHEIKCPSLIIGADQDCVKPPQFSELIAKNIKDSHLHIFKDTGHAVFSERFTEISVMIDNLISNRNVNSVIFNSDMISKLTNNRFVN